MRSRLAAPLTLAAVALALTGAATASAAKVTVTGGRWAVAAERETPLRYFQGLTHTAAEDFLFVGVFRGGYRTDGALRELAGNDNLIPAAVEGAVGFNHIGDPTFDRSSGGRLLVPLECYIPGTANGGNTCGMGGIGVVDPQTLAWKYWVRLDPADIPKAMWAEVSPDGRRLWTSSGSDLLAYDVADISPAHAAADATTEPISPAVRLRNAVPASGVTGAVFDGARLLLAGEADRVLQIASVDVRTGKGRVELTAPGLQAEPEGLDVLDNGGGELHWLLSPFGDNGDPTYGAGHSELLTLIPTSGLVAEPAASPRTIRAGRRTKVVVAVSQIYASHPHPVNGATVKVAGASAKTNARGQATLKVTARRRGTLKVTASATGLKTGRGTITVK